MAYELKNWFDRAFFEGLAESLAERARDLDTGAFVTEACAGLEPLSIMERLQRTADLCDRHLSGSYAAKLKIVSAVVPRYEGHFRALFAPEFVARFGRHDRARSLKALHHLTRFGSAEFAIRPFILDDPGDTLALMAVWAGDGKDHVRRLASEGCRPRLPWSFRLASLIDDPAPVLPILERLKGDSSLYVRKFVANHLNDIGKDHPELMLDVVHAWDRSIPETAWIVRHACRSLIKAGHPRALALQGFGDAPQIRIENLAVAPAAVPWQGTAEISFDLVSIAKKPQRLAVDYALHYRKASGRTAPKVFKLKELELEPGARVWLGSKRSLAEKTTRKHYPGEHRVELLINGVSSGEAAFELLAAT